MQYTFTLAVFKKLKNKELSKEIGESFVRISPLIIFVFLVEKLKVIVFFSSANKLIYCCDFCCSLIFKKTTSSVIFSMPLLLTTTCRAISLFEVKIGLLI